MLGGAALLCGFRHRGVKKWDIVRSASVGIHFCKADRHYVYADSLSFGGTRRETWVSVPVPCSTIAKRTARNALRG
jgi:hypothetical protein